MDRTRVYWLLPGMDRRIGFAETVNGTTSFYYYLTDQVGTVLRIVKEDGTVVNQYDYDAFGRTRTSSETVENRYLFQGREWDRNGGFYYFRNRIYLPERGEFSSPDMNLGRGILGELDGMATLTFCGGDPVNCVDPTGLEVVWWNPLTYTLGVSGTEASSLAIKSRDMIDQLMAEKSKKNLLSADMMGYVGTSMVREHYYSFLTRSARYFEMGGGNNPVTLADYYGALYEAQGSLMFEMIPFSGSALKSYTGEVIDDRGNDVRELSTWKRVGYGALAGVEVLGVAQGYSMLKKMSGSAAAEVLPKTVAQEVGTVVKSPPPLPPAGAGVAKLKKWFRLDTVGRTPGKTSKTGRKVIDQARAKGKITEDPELGTLFEDSKGVLRPLAEADMAHKVDAVSWWNTIGRQYGAKAPEVRQWMLDPNNYYLEYFRYNRSAGAKLTETYLAPLK